MKLPGTILIHRTLYATDGGTILLEVFDENGNNYEIRLNQHAFPHRRSSNEIPGRLYFDRQLVPIRSEAEKAIMNLLRNMKIQIDPPKGDQNQTHEIISFVESEEYIQFAQKVELAASQTLYTAWVTWNSENRNHVIVRLGQALGLDMKAARMVLEQNMPIGKNLTALEVSDLTMKYKKMGLEIKTEKTA
jgi:hypothetical protein